MAPSATMRLYGSVFTTVLILLDFGGALGAVSSPDETPTKPCLVVFDFESEWDDGRLGRKAAEIFRGHARRRRVFIQLDPLSFAEVLASSGAEVRMDTAVADISNLIADKFDAEVAIWGAIEPSEKGDYLLHVKIVDRRINPEALALDETYTSTLHGIQISVDAALDKFLGKTRSEKPDILADETWRTRVNLCKNGSFERGKGTPEGWESVDGLATFWVDNVSPAGRCVMLDTNVLDSQYREWRAAFEQGAPASEAPKKLPTRAPYYDTIGGLAGAHIYSDYIPIKQGQAYRIDLDARGPSSLTTKCFVKGYATFRSAAQKTELREVYRAQINVNMRTTDPTDWEHYAMIFHPTQPLLLLTIRSDFDDGKTGELFRAALAKQLEAEGLIEMKDADDVAERISGKDHLIQVEASKYDIAHVVTACLDRGYAVWGDVIQTDRGLEVRIRSLDVRSGGTATKDWPEPKKWKTRKSRFKKTAKDVAAAVLENARVVTQLRVKLDAYWPVGEYYFDNVSITEEPASSQ